MEGDKGRDDVGKAVSQLTYNGINVSDKVIGVSPKRPVGIRLWAVIDFLCHFCGYRWEKVR